MRLLAAMMKHETNTFSPVPTNLARFSRGQSSPPSGPAAYNAYRHTGTALGAFIDLAEQHSARLDIAVAGSAAPSGRVPDAVFEHFCERILDAADSSHDAVLLDLHGAMVTDSYEDGEGELLRRLRALLPNTPIGVALDMHTNLYDAMVENASVLAGYQTYPHIDHYQTGLRAAQAIIDSLHGKCTPSMAGGRRAMLPHVMRQSSEDFPNRELQARCKEMERDGALCASVFTGFPHADIHDAGLSAVVVTNNDADLARHWCDELLDSAWENRAAFVYSIEPLSESLRRASRTEQGPIILLDHYDNCASGGSMDTMTVLQGILEQGLENVAAFAIYDPEAVQQLVSAGVGAEVTIPLGGRTDMPSIGLSGTPLSVSGKVRLISDGRYHNEGPIQSGVLMDMGRTVILDTGKVEIVVVSKHQEPSDLRCFTSLGIDPTSKRFLMLKSRIHYRAAFKPIVKEIIECAGTGVCTSDYDSLKFENVRRPIYPLDLSNT